MSDKSLMIVRDEVCDNRFILGTNPIKFNPIPTITKEGVVCVVIFGVKQLKTIPEPISIEFNSADKLIFGGDNPTKYNPIHANKSDGIAVVERVGVNAFRIISTLRFNVSDDNIIFGVKVVNVNPVPTIKPEAID